MRDTNITDLIHQRSYIREILRISREEYFTTDGTLPRRQVISEDAPYADRIVSQTSIIKVVGMLGEIEKLLSQELEKFEIRVREPDTIVTKALKRREEPQKEPSNGTPGEAPPTKKKKPPLPRPAAGGDEPKPSSKADEDGGGDREPE